MSALLAFASTFCAVFTLGLQSRLVNTENYAGAAVNSVLISGSHLFLYKVMPASAWWSLEQLAYVVGGVAGITTSIWFHQRATAWWKARQATLHHRRRGQFPPKPPPPRPCGRCGDGYPFACHRPDCPRIEGSDTH